MSRANPARSAHNSELLNMHIARFSKNEKGRDFIIGDIHGCFSSVVADLIEIEFDDTKDRLFSVGDLVDRGAESGDALDWIAKPWFHAVMGNHEQMAIMHQKGGIDNQLYAMNGGSWFMSKTEHEKAVFAQVFNDLPLAIEIETDSGLIGIIHAECPYNDWNKLRENVATLPEYALDCALWNRNRIQTGLDDNILNVHQVFVGHTPINDPVRLGNVYYIDTMGWRKEGRFTIVCI